MLHRLADKHPVERVAMEVRQASEARDASLV